MNDIIDKLKRVRRGAMFIIEGPSGTGKGAVCKEILAQDEHIKFSVSVTTRPKRDTEIEDVDYHLFPMWNMTGLKPKTLFMSVLILNTARVTELCVRRWMAF